MWKLVEFLRAFAGDARAQLSIAVDYMAASKDYRYGPKALYWARRAGRGGERRGYLLAANIIISNEPAAEGWKQVFEAYWAAAHAGDADGQQGLAWCYEQGMGVYMNLERGWHWLNIAAANGSKSAQLALSRRYADGDGVERDEARARVYRELVEQHEKVKKRPVEIPVPYPRGGTPDEPSESRSAAKG
jgi:TPR repeat protein